MRFLPLALVALAACAQKHPQTNIGVQAVTCTTAKAKTSCTIQFNTPAIVAQSVTVVLKNGKKETHPLPKGAISIKITSPSPVASAYMYDHKPVAAKAE